MFTKLFSANVDVHEVMSVLWYCSGPGLSLWPWLPSRPGVRHKEGEEEEDAFDPYSSLVTTTTVVTTTDEAEV